MFLEIDGSEGEGGGQILRSSLAMSAILNRPVRIRNIRSGRPNPGLQAQHLTCVNALAEITEAELKGAELGSQELSFVPHTIKSGIYRFDVAKIKPSAGSVSLVFQAVLLPLAFANDISRITILGGTHVPWSPTVNYLQKVYLPIIARMNLNADIQLKNWGWYPKGGGEIYAEVSPAKLAGIDLSQRDKYINTTGISASSNLPDHIIQRQEEQAARIFTSKGIDVRLELVRAPSRGQGTVVFILTEFERSLAGFESLGEKGKKAEHVAEDACRNCLKFIESGSAIDEHLADQIVPLMALAKGHSCFTTPRISLHLLTNIRVAERFLPVKFQISGNEGQPGFISVDGIGFAYK